MNDVLTRAVKSPGRLLVLLFAGALAVQVATACSCSGPRPGLEALEANDATFTGMVLSSTALDLDPYGQGSEGFFRYTIRIETRYKGMLPGRSTVTLSTTSAPFGCGYKVQVGETHLFSAQRVGGELFTYVCGGNAQFEYEDQRVTAEAAVAEIEAAGYGVRSNGCGFGSPFGMLQSVVLLGLGAAVVRRKAFSNPTPVSR